MKQLEKILAPIDISSDYKEQLETIVKMSKLYNSQVIITYVLSEDVGSEDMRDVLLKDVSKTLNKIVKILKKEKLIVHDPIITHGKLIENILKVAVKEGVGLIIAGAGSRHLNEKHKLGNTVEKLMRHSSIPVWVVKKEKSSEISNIICPVDFSEPSRCALKNGLLLARDFDAKLRVLGVTEPLLYVSPRIQVDMEAENDRRMKHLEAEMTEFLSEFDFIAVDYTVDLRLGKIATEILDAIKEFDHDLLIMGTTGRSGLRKVMMGSVTEEVTRHMPCSFITTKSRDFIQSRFHSDVIEMEAHFKEGIELFNKDLLKDAITEFTACLRINPMYIPANYKLSKIYRKTGDEAKAVYYENTAKELLDRMWDKDIEAEIREDFSSSN